MVPASPRPLRLRPCSLLHSNPQPASVPIRLARLARRTQLVLKQPTSLPLPSPAPSRTDLAVSDFPPASPELMLLDSVGRGRAEARQRDRGKCSMSENHILGSQRQIAYRTARQSLLRLWRTALGSSQQPNRHARFCEKLVLPAPKPCVAQFGACLQRRSAPSVVFEA